ncbi:hypothetical protein C1646_675122 [Rhizophagus diaphanus]|nr:hypothetical protein C1646_675122 [Rhizophagus diaphanus] [Rhizophagus sp. MUCL 43196]
MKDKSLRVRSELLYVRSDVLDFTIGSDGIIFCIQKDNKIYIRNYYYNEWNQIDDGSYYFSNKISACSYKTIYTINDKNHLIKVDSSRYYHHVSCAPDNSLWIIGPDDYVYLYVNYFISVPVAEIVFKQIKALHEKYVIGIDYYDNLWEYNSGTWVQIRNTGGKYFVVGTEKQNFSIGADGTVVIIKNDNEVYIRTHANKWERISYGNYEHKNISVNNYYVIYTIDSHNYLIQASYDLMSDTYNWNCVIDTLDEDILRVRSRLYDIGQNLVKI